MKLKCIGGSAAGQWVDLDVDRDGINVVKDECPQYFPGGIL